MEIDLINRVRGLQQVYYVGLNVAPHDPTRQSSVTVPPNEMAYVPYAYLHVVRKAEATTLGLFGMYILGSIFGATGATIVRLNVYKNTIGSSDKVVVPLNLIMRGGDLLELWTFDQSTGGVVTYVGYVPVYNLI